MTDDERMLAAWQTIADRAPGDGSPLLSMTRGELSKLLALVGRNRLIETGALWCSVHHCIKSQHARFRCPRSLDTESAATCVFRPLVYQEENT